MGAACPERLLVDNPEGGRRRFPLAQLTHLELEELRHLIGVQQLTVNKLNEYVRDCRDPQLKAHFQHLASTCHQDTQRLMGFLG